MLEPSDHQQTWLKYASLCRKSNRQQLSHRALVTILGCDPSANLEHPLPTAIPQATFAYCKYLWGSGKKQNAFSQLHNFVKRFLQPRISQLSSAASPDIEAEQQLVETRKLLARCYLKLGSWQENLQGLPESRMTSREEGIATVLQYYQVGLQNCFFFKVWRFSGPYFVTFCCISNMASRL